MKKILAIDGWTKGSHHLSPLARELRKFHIELILIHTGSYGHDIGRPTEEEIDDMKVRDISYYANINILKILKVENPVALIFLSTRAFLHQTFIRYSSFLSIPTFHRFHGLISVQPIHKKTSTFKPNLINRLRLIANVLPKNLFKIWPIYFQSLIITKANFKTLKMFFVEIFSKMIYLNIPAPIDSRTDYAFIYTNADLNYAHKTYHIQKKNIFTVGNPDLVSFDVDEKKIRMRDIHNVQKNVVYINTGLLEEGTVFKDEEDLIQHFLNTNKSLNENGFKLLLKPHPSTNKRSITKKLEENNVEIIENDLLVEKIKNCSFCIVEPSSASILPCLFGVPIMLAKYGKLKFQEYGFVLNSYPFSVTLSSENQINQLNKFNHKKISKSDFKNWIKMNLGPLPSKDIHKRIAKIINQKL